MMAISVKIVDELLLTFIALSKPDIAQFYVSFSLWFGYFRILRKVMGLEGNNADFFLASAPTPCSFRTNHENTKPAYLKKSKLNIFGKLVTLSYNHSLS